MAAASWICAARCCRLNFGAMEPTLLGSTSTSQWLKKCCDAPQPALETKWLPQNSMPELQSLVKTLRDSVKGTRHSTLNSHNSKRKPRKSAIDTQDPTLGAQTSVLNAQNSMLKLHELTEDSWEPNQRYSKLN